MKKMRRLCAATALICLLLLSLVACGECRHKQTEWVTEREGTCTVVCIEAEKCLKCGETVKTREVVVNCAYEEGVCVYCGEARYGSDYLTYREITLNGETGYEVVDRGNRGEKNLKIPALYRGKPVLAIAAFAFEEADELLTLTVGSNVQVIGDAAFRGCGALTSVQFAEGSELLSLGREAFAGCTALSAFAVPAGVRHLPARLFEGCTALAEVLLHDGLLTFGDDAFLECEALTYKTGNGMSFLGTKENPYLALMHVERTATAVAVPDSVVIVASGAFNGCTALGSVTLPEGVLSLCSYAFAGCTTLSELTLPTTLTRIGEYALAGCETLAALDLPAGLTEIGTGAFRGCTQLSSLSLPDTLRYVGELAFFGTALPLAADGGGGKYLGNAQNPYFLLVEVADRAAASLTVNESTVVIAGGALASTALSSLHLPAAVTVIGVRALAGCEALTAVTFATATGWNLREYAVGEDKAISTDDAAAAAVALAVTYANFYWQR